MADDLFDDLKAVTHDVVTNVMGVTAYFTPSAGGPEQQNDVLYNDPTTVEKLGDIEYMPTNYFAEYRAPFFPELEPSVKAGGNEFLKIKGVDYYVQKVKRMFDGDTFIAILELKDNE